MNFLKNTTPSSRLRRCAKSLRCEIIYHNRYKTREEAHKDFWYIEIYYNRKERHQVLRYMTPNAVQTSVL
ncbi:IS3 family transposase [Tepidanaerobacter syntrophicus]|uniref:IS3 family transposase n=1 Tax=Tepidanaerobacter syntrophicus TaxID=224999 RepID=UPI0035A235A5